MKFLSVTKKGLMIKFLLGFVCLLVPRLTPAEFTETVESLYEDARHALTHFEKEMTLRERRELNRKGWKNRRTLSPHLRQKYRRWHELLEQRDMWESAVELKQDLSALYLSDSERTTLVKSEADHMSREMIQIMYRYRKEWRMLNSALFHNLLINMKIKKKGFCWHWVEKFLGTLRSIGLRHFDFYWGVAYEGNFRENNALVITRHRAPFETGLAVDAWRSSGRPFWRLVKKDRFPWVERDEREQ